ncbi:hypothetical protein ERO13_D04G125250v2 [Gossypium hirsutum]|nr:hypothetical protein ES319_D04G144300v1 [Gossypium barbadense]KAG4152480.1 hypothetical protein ERO13_D04G125250v2 [Gossypium hirsutum]TYI87594.1 hypothetical protein E1A91_D04G146400v1 [Gossypium mustelinum]
MFFLQKACSAPRPASVAVALFLNFTAFTNHLPVDHSFSPAFLSQLVYYLDQSIPLQNNLSPYGLSPFPRLFRGDPSV